MQRKKKAASKICKWWRGKRLELKEKKKEGTAYLELAVENDNLKEAQKPETIRNIRLLEKTCGGRNLVRGLNLLIRTERTRD